MGFGDRGFVKGHGFSRANRADKMTGLQPLPTILTTALRKNYELFPKPF